MVRILFLAIVLGWIPLLACSGDCLACHPALAKSIDAPHHRVIERCIACHKGRSTGAASCGSDCFDCHDRRKLARSALPEHRAIVGCARCHISPKELITPADPFTLP